MSETNKNNHDKVYSLPQSPISNHNSPPDFSNQPAIDLSITQNFDTSKENTSNVAASQECTFTNGVASVVSTISYLRPQNHGENLFSNQVATDSLSKRKDSNSGRLSPKLSKNQVTTKQPFTTSAPVQAFQPRESSVSTSQKHLENISAEPILEINIWHLNSSTTEKLLKIRIKTIDAINKGIVDTKLYFVKDSDGDTCANFLILLLCRLHSFLNRKLVFYYRTS